MVISLVQDVFKMSDQPEGSDSKQSSREGGRTDNSKASSLKDATHKLKAEALRRLQLGDADYESEGAKNNEARQGSSSPQNDGNAQEGVDDGDHTHKINPEEGDLLSVEKENNTDVSDGNDPGSNIDETRESGDFSQDAAKPTDSSLGDSESGNAVDQNRQKVLGSDTRANEDGQTSSEDKDQSINKGDASLNQGENAKEGASDSVFSKGSRPLSSQGQEGTSQGSRPGSGGARPGSGSRGAGKGKRSDQKPGSRPGSAGGSRSRPGTGSKGSRQEAQSSSRPVSGAGSKSRPQSGSKREATGSEGGTLGQAASSNRGVGDETTRKDSASVDPGSEGGTLVQAASSGRGVGDKSTGKYGASVDDETNKTARDLSTSKIGKDVAGDGSTDKKSTSSSNIFASQTLSADSVDQGKEDGDTSNLSINNKSADNTSSDNKSESKQTGDNDQISDEVSPPMNKEEESKVEGIDSKQNSDPLSNAKQDPAVTETGKDEKQGEQSDSVEGGKEKASSFEQAEPGDAETVGQKDASEEDGSKDNNAAEGQEGAAKSGDKEGSSIDATIDKKHSREAQEGDVAKSGETESAEVKTETGQGASDRGDVEESSGKQTTEGQKSDAAGDKPDGKKEDGSDKKEEKKKVKKENAEQGDEEEDKEEDKDAGETERTVEEPQPTEAKQAVPGNSVDNEALLGGRGGACLYSDFQTFFTIL